MYILSFLHLTREEFSLNETTYYDGRKLLILSEYALIDILVLSSESCV